MGNRAYICFIDGAENISPLIYVHWHGGSESVYTLIGVLENYLCPKKCGDYIDVFSARFVQLVGNFFGSVDSLGIYNVKINDLDKYDTDNGLYLYNIENGKMTRYINKKKMSDEWVLEEKESALSHVYNTSGDLLNEIKQKNDLHFLNYLNIRTQNDTVQSAIDNLKLVLKLAGEEI